MSCQFCHEMTKYVKKKRRTIGISEHFVNSQEGLDQIINQSQCLIDKVQFPIGLAKLLYSQKADKVQGV